MLYTIETLLTRTKAKEARCICTYKINAAKISKKEKK